MEETTFPEFLEKLRGIDPKEYDSWIEEIKKLPKDKQDKLLGGK